MALDIGRIAFEAWSEDIDDQPSKWEALNKKHQDAWRHAAVAVLKYIDSCKDLPDDVDG